MTAIFKNSKKIGKGCKKHLKKDKLMDVDDYG